VNYWLNFDGSKDIFLHSMYSDFLYPPYFERLFCDSEHMSHSFNSYIYANIITLSYWTAGTSIFDSSDQKEWIYSCGVKYLAFDAKQFSRTFEKLRWRGSSWLIDFGVDDLKEVILLLIPDAEQHRVGRGDLELMSPEWEGMTIQM
jgi:hypothetical protein